MLISTVSKTIRHHFDCSRVNLHIDRTRLECHFHLNRSSAFEISLSRRRHSLAAVVMNSICVGVIAFFKEDFKSLERHRASSP